MGGMWGDSLLFETVEAANKQKASKIASKTLAFCLLENIRCKTYEKVIGGR